MITALNIWQRVKTSSSLIVVAAAMTACRQSADSKLVGHWIWETCDDAGDVSYESDHTFASRQRAISHTQQPPVIVDGGNWHVERGLLIVEFRGDSRMPNARRVTFEFMLFGADTLVVRRANGEVHTLRRAH